MYSATGRPALKAVAALIMLTCALTPMAVASARTQAQQQSPVASATNHLTQIAQGTLAPATRVHYVSPVNRSHELRGAYRVTSAGRGSCWTSSILHPELYRCLFGNYIQDPCWPEAGRQTVVCLSSPWRHAVTRLRLTDRLPRVSSGHGSVWGLTLNSGNRCLGLAGGTREVWRGHVVNYYCQNHWVLLDTAHRQHRTRQIRTARDVGKHYEPRGFRPLTDAWRPKGP